MIQAVFKDAVCSDLTACPTYWAYIVAFRLSRSAELAGSDSSLPGIGHPRPRGFGSRSFRAMAVSLKGCWFVENLSFRNIIIPQSPWTPKPNLRPLDNVWVIGHSGASIVHVVLTQLIRMVDPPSNIVIHGARASLRGSMPPHTINEKQALCACSALRGCPGLALGLDVAHCDKNDRFWFRSVRDMEVDEPAERRTRGGEWSGEHMVRWVLIT
jgi:hypothetical protein